MFRYSQKLFIVCMLAGAPFAVASAQPQPAPTTSPGTTSTTTTTTPTTTSTTSTTPPAPGTTATPTPPPSTTSTTTTSTTTTATATGTQPPTTTTTSTTVTTTVKPPEPPPPPLPPPPPPESLGVGALKGYQFGQQAQLNKPLWTASASLGFSATTGNSNVISLSGGAQVSRNDGWNKIALSAEGVYGITRALALSDMNANGKADTSDEVIQTQTTTAAFFTASARYDRFFTAHNSGYITLLSGFDLPASLRAKVAGQIGYARQIVKTSMHELSGEVGYDFTFDKLIPPEMLSSDFNENVSLHSARLFLGYLLTVSTHTIMRANFEALVNLNGVVIADREVGPGAATRIKGKLEFTTRIWRPLSFRAAFTARFNNAPALRATPMLMFAADSPDRYNQTFDTLTELGIVVQFL